MPTCSGSIASASTPHRTEPARRCSCATTNSAPDSGSPGIERGTGDAFDEARVGLDHLAFAVTSRAELDDWARRFTESGVAFSPVASANSIPGAAVLVFRDPDNIQLELFFDPSAAAR